MPAGHGEGRSRRGAHGFLEESPRAALAPSASGTRCCFTGRLINSIRVICRSYDDYREWLDCLKTAQFRNADSSLSGSESFSGSKQPHLGQVTGAAGSRGPRWMSPGALPVLPLAKCEQNTLVTQQALLQVPHLKARGVPGEVL